MTTEEAPLTPEVEARIAGYRCRAHPPELSKAVSDFARAAVRATTPQSIASANTRLSNVARLALWCRSVGYPLTTEVVFHPDTIDRFMVVGCNREELGRATVQSSLKTIGRKLEPALWPPLPEGVPRNKAKSAYTPSEIDALLRLAEAQPTRLRRIRGIAAICLGAGAGLQSGEIRLLSTDDIQTTDHGLIVHVRHAPAPRRVPVRAPFADRLLAIKNEVQSGGFFKPSSKNLLQQFAVGFKGGRGVPKLDMDRLRATWLVAHLSAMGFKELISAYGADRPQQIFDHLAAMPAPSLDMIVAKLAETDRP